MAAEAWSVEDIPDLTGKTFVVTGANSGIGFETARELARRGGRVVMACRNLDKATAAMKRIVADVPDARLEPWPLDLSDLASVRSFAEGLLRDHDRLDVLVNNAGVMAIPHGRTRDGFELQMGTNHFGPFALTGLLLGRLLATAGSRVVTVSSLMHRMGRIRFDDLDGERHYNKWTAYAQSKLANLLFAFELQRRLERAGASTLSVACHPGYSSTNLALAGPKMAGSRMGERLHRLAQRVAAQDAAAGAWPTLRAATAPDVRGGDYFGPGGFQEIWGPPAAARPSARARDQDAAARLWEISEERTGVRYVFEPIDAKSEAPAAGGHSSRRP